MSGPRRLLGQILKENGLIETVRPVSDLAIDVSVQ